MIDGLKTEDYKGDDVTLTDDLVVGDLISGANIVAAGSITANTANTTSRFSTLTCGGSILVTGAVSGANTATFSSVTVGGKTLSPIGTGSPTLSNGRWAQAGVGTTGAGSNAWHAFATAFSAAPTAVLVCPTETAEAFYCPAGSWAAGSFYVETASASQTFSWMAIQ